MIGELYVSYEFYQLFRYLPEACDSEITLQISLS